MIRRLTLFALLFLCLGAFAQEVHIPDPNHRGAIHDALDTPRGAPITRDDMLELVRFDAGNRDGNSDIASLSGLEYATNLVDLALPHKLVLRYKPDSRSDKTHGPEPMGLSKHRKYFPACTPAQPRHTVASQKQSERFEAIVRIDTAWFSRIGTQSNSGYQSVGIAV